jgi:hypothetical protein
LHSGKRRGHSFFSASYYLINQREEGDLYSEVYSNVAVLFASIPDYMDEFR